MVGTYQRKRPQKYTREQLLAAIQAVKVQNMKVPVDAAKYGVPRTTLYDHVN